MIDKILQTYDSFFGKFDMGYDPSSPSRFPEATDTLYIGNIEMPLYGSVLYGEIRLLEQLVELQTRISESYNRIISELKAETASIADIKRTIKVGYYQQVVQTAVKVDWKKLGQIELAKIATELNLEVFTNTIIGEDRRVQDIVENYYSIWLDAGYVAASGLELANQVLSKQVPVKTELGELVKFEPQDILELAGITWDELEIIDSLLNLDLPYLLIIKFRTGVGQYNIFDYLPPVERKRVIDALKVEISTSPKADTPPVAENPNVDTTTTEGGAEAANLT